MAARATHQYFPRFPLMAAISLVVLSILAAAFGRYTGIGTLKVEPDTAVAVRDIVFTENSNGTIDVHDAAQGAHIATVGVGQDNFIRGAMRGLARSRMQRSIGAEEPFRLIRWENGQLSISDTITGQRVYLDAFGPTNAGAFARFLHN